jgi:hypothetical protein
MFRTAIASAWADNVKSRMDCIVSAGEDIAIPNDNRPDRHVARVACVSSLFQSQSHESFVIALRQNILRHQSYISAIEPTLRVLQLSTTIAICSACRGMAL